MRKFFILALLAVVVGFTISCNKAGKTGLLVPKDAAVVMHINMSSLSSKLSWDEIKQTEWFQEIGQNERDTLTKAFMDDPAKSGIDTKGNHVFFLAKKGNGGYFAFVGALKDAVAYESAISKMQNGQIQIKKDGDFSVAFPGESAAIIWDKSHFVVIGNAPFGQMRGMYGRGSEFSKDSLQLLGKAVLNLKGDDLLDSDKRFANLISENGDLHFWINSEKVYGDALGGMVAMMKVNTLLENNVATATLDFDNGKIAVRARQYFGTEMTSLVKKYSPKEVSSDVINRLPSQQAIAAGVFNYPPEGLKELLKMTGVDGMANGFLGKVNYSIDEFVKANKGDIAFAITDFNIKRDTNSYQDWEGKTAYSYGEKPSVKFVAGVAVNDRAAFDKLLGLVVQETAKDPAPGVTYKLDNNWFVASNDEAQLTSFLAGNNKPAYADKIKGHSAGFFVDLQQIMKVYLSQPATDTVGNEYKASARKALEASAAFWQDVVVSSDIKDGTAVSSIEINLVDKSTNSLKQLAKYGDRLKALKPKKSDFTDEPLIDMTPADSIRVAPVK